METIESIIRFASAKRMVIMADEVYVENIYSDKKKFVSFKKVRSTLAHPFNSVELISFGSASKGFLGECGLRGGFMEFNNIDAQVMQQLIKLKSISLCSNTVGQCMMGLLCGPPSSENGASAETVDAYNAQKNATLASLKQRARIVTQKLNQMVNIQCQEIEGAMYAFPKIRLS